MSGFYVSHNNVLKIPLYVNQQGLEKVRKKSKTALALNLLGCLPQVTIHLTFDTISIFSWKVLSFILCRHFAEGGRVLTKEVPECNDNEKNRFNANTLTISYTFDWYIETKQEFVIVFTGPVSVFLTCICK